MSARTYADFREIEQRMYADDAARHPEGGNRLAEALAKAMLDAKAGASVAGDGAEQMRRTIAMAEWIIARLPFHGLALIEHGDGLSDDERETRYRAWLRRENRR